MSVDRGRVNSNAAERRLRIHKFALVTVVLIVVTNFGCGIKSDHRSLPNDVESAIGDVTDDIRGERYETVYTEAADLWRQDATLEQSIQTFKTLRTKLGEIENRALQSAAEQDNSSGPLKGRVFIVTYRTKFQHGEGMETFTLVERDGRWRMARYFVNSTALQ